ncbi:MAG: phosphatase PAP2 family protein [Acidimicrobiales bacterium]
MTDAPRTPLGHRPALLAGVAVAAVVYGAAWLVLERSPGRLSSLEQRAFEAVNGAPDLLGTLLWPVMQLGVFWAVPVVAMVAWLVWNRPAPAATAAFAGFAAWALAKAGKVLVDRGRPSAFLEANVREAGLSDFGFPSGHSAVAFALATALAPWLGPRWRIAGYGAAVLVALARLVVGAHLPLDVVGGAAIGVACGLVARLVVGEPTGPTTSADPARASAG